MGVAGGGNLYGGFLCLVWVQVERDKVSRHALTILHGQNRAGQVSFLEVHN